MQHTNLTFEPVAFLNCPNNGEDEFPKKKSCLLKGEYCELPARLQGD